MSLRKTEINKLLEKEEICYLATADLKGNPHVKPIWFAVRSGKIWFHTGTDTKSFKNVSENNKIMLCFGGKKTYLVWATVKGYKEKDAPIPWRRMLWDKYANDMEDSYIDEKTRIFEVIIKKETSWHYADQDWE